MCQQDPDHCSPSRGQKSENLFFFFGSFSFLFFNIYILSHKEQSKINFTIILYIKNISMALWLHERKTKKSARESTYNIKYIQVCMWVKLNRSLYTQRSSTRAFRLLRQLQVWGGYMTPLGAVKFCGEGEGSVWEEAATHSGCSSSDNISVVGFRRRGCALQETQKKNKKRKENMHSGQICVCCCFCLLSSS